MAIRKIVTLGDETLRKHCKPQEKFDKRLATLLKDMADTMYKAEGVGLAAPQVGILRRLAVVDVTEDHSGLLEMVNPEIIEREGQQTGREGCLSVPGRQGVVTRPMRIKARFQDRNGDTYEIETEGFEARAICHELDHLDGTLYIDVMDRELNEEEIHGHIPEDEEQ
ncbi:MAG: peptide deformylase [Clostridia bacterium]|nr:peptide deformylase [Clostridia bacterium]